MYTRISRYFTGWLAGDSPVTQLHIWCWEGPRGRGVSLAMQHTGRGWLTLQHDWFNSRNCITAVPQPSCIAMLHPWAWLTTLGELHQQSFILQLHLNNYQLRNIISKCVSNKCCAKHRVWGRPRWRTGLHNIWWGCSTYIARSSQCMSLLPLTCRWSHRRKLVRQTSPELSDCTYSSLLPHLEPHVLAGHLPRLVVSSIYTYTAGLVSMHASRPDIVWSTAICSCMFLHDILVSSELNNWPSYRWTTMLQHNDVLSLIGSQRHHRTTPTTW